MCKKSPFPRCSSHARSRLTKAMETGDLQEIKKAKIEYYTTPEGIKTLKNAGKNELAEKFSRRRAQKIEHAQRIERIANKVTLALDLDNTTVDFNGRFRHHLAKKYNLTPEQALVKYPEPHDYSFVKSGWFKDTDEFHSEFHEAERAGVYREMSIYPGARKTIQTLQQKGYTLHVVTARRQEYNEDTKAALRRYRMPYRKLVHTEEKETQEAHLFFDDAPKQITTLTAHGKKVVTFHASYNGNDTGVGRVNDWSQVEAMADKHTRNVKLVQPKTV